MLNDRVVLRDGEFHLLRDGRSYVLQESRTPHIYTFVQDGILKKCFFFM